MSSDGISKYFWISGGLIFLVGLIIFALVFKTDLIDIYQSITNSNDTTNTDPVTFVDPNSSFKYEINREMLDDERIFEFILNTDVDWYNKIVSITNEKVGFAASYAKNDETVAGFNYKIDHEQQNVNLVIYLNDSLEPNDRQYYLNLSYVAALLSAAEDNKRRADPTYLPQFKSGDQAAYEVVADMYDSNEYAINWYD